MNTSSLPKLLFVTLAAGGLLLQTASALITVETVPVGNAGNEADPTTGFGAVGYDYGIGKYEVTWNQYTAFLNAVGTDDTYGLYNEQMGWEPTTMGISRTGASGSYSYSVIAYGARPVTCVSWYDSARFVNWLHNGQPVGAQAAGTTETGAYTLTGNAGTIMRNSGSTYSLPSEDEWYKAAYHQPVSLGGDSDNYWLYPTRSSTVPTHIGPNNTDPNSANYDLVGSITDVGAYSLAASFYGTFDQGGNVWEWNDAVIGSSARGLRGGSRYDNELYLRASLRFSFDPALESVGVGFRIAIVPEPSAAGLVALGMALVAWKRK